LIHVLFRQCISSGEGIKNTEKEKSMSNNNEKRVLSRMGARQLTANEIDQVAAAKLTFASVLATGPVNNPDETFDQ
jgi:hypothetical protein